MRKLLFKAAMLVAVTLGMVCCTNEDLPEESNITEVVFATRAKAGVEVETNLTSNTHNGVVTIQVYKNTLDNKCTVPVEGEEPISLSWNGSEYNSWQVICYGTYDKQTKVYSWYKITYRHGHKHNGGTIMF